MWSAMICMISGLSLLTRTCFIDQHHLSYATFVKVTPKWYISGLTPNKKLLIDMPGYHYHLSINQVSFFPFVLSKIWLGQVSMMKNKWLMEDNSG